MFHAVVFLRGVVAERDGEVHGFLVLMEQREGVLNDELLDVKAANRVLKEQVRKLEKDLQRMAQEMEEREKEHQEEVGAQRRRVRELEEKFEKERQKTEERLEKLEKQVQSGSRRMKSRRERTAQALDEMAGLKTQEAEIVTGQIAIEIEKETLLWHVEQLEREADQQLLRAVEKERALRSFDTFLKHCSDHREERIRALALQTKGQSLEMICEAFELDEEKASHLKEDLYVLRLCRLDSAHPHASMERFERCLELVEDVHVKGPARRCFNILQRRRPAGT